MKLLIASGFVLAGLWLAKAESPGERERGLEARVSAAISNWRAITPEFLREPNNRELLVALREKAKNPNEIAARAILLNAEDPSVIKLCLAQMHDENVYDRADGAKIFEQCNQPKLIAVLADDLNREESAAGVKVVGGEEVIRKTAISVLATQAILGIIANSPQFSDEVKAWASKVPVRTFRDDKDDAARASVRKWWQESEKLLRSERYAEVRPPAS